MKTVIKTAIQHNIPLYLESAPGFGKSSLVRQIANELGMPLVDIRAAALLPEDISGIPTVIDGSVKFHAPEWVGENAKRPFVLFLDELNQASPSVQKALYQVAHDRVWAGVHMPYAMLIAAGNPREMWGELDELSPALVGQCGRFTPLRLEAKTLWPYAVRFLLAQEDVTERSKKCIAYAIAMTTDIPSCPRSWHKAMMLLSTVGDNVSSYRDIIVTLTSAQAWQYIRAALTSPGPEKPAPKGEAQAIAAHFFAFGALPKERDERSVQTRARQIITSLDVERLRFVVANTIAPHSAARAQAEKSLGTAISDTEWEAILAEIAEIGDAK